MMMAGERCIVMEAPTREPMAVRKLGVLAAATISVGVTPENAKMVTPKTRGLLVEAMVTCCSLIPRPMAAATADFRFWSKVETVCS